MVDLSKEPSLNVLQDDGARHLWHAPAEFLDSLPVALYLCGSDGRLLRYNQRAADLWGRRPILDHPADRYCGFLRAYLPDGTPLQRDRSPIATVLRDGSALRDIDLVGERPDGSRVNVVVSIDAVRGPADKILGALVCLQDVTARKRLEQSVSRRMGEQAALYEFTDRLFRAGSRSEVYDAALDAIIRALGCSRASVLLFGDDGEMRFVAWRGLSEIYRAAVAGHSPWRPGDRDASPVCVPDIEVAELPESLRAAVRRERIGALAFIPLAVDGAVIGKFMTYYATPHRFGEEEIELAVTIARQLGFCLERLRSDEARVAAEQALSSERELLRTIIDRAPLMVSLYNPVRRKLQLNREFERLVGWLSEEVTAASLMEYCYPDPLYRARVAAFIESCRDGWMDITMQTRSGRAIDTSWTNFRLSDGTRVGIGIEITDRKRAEAQQALLLGEMSHRLRNLFVVASSVVSMSARDAHTPGEMAEAVQDRLSALTRAHDLTRPGSATTQPDRERETTLLALLAAVLLPYAAADSAPRFISRGCDVLIGGEAVTGLALLLHEFTTNAAKHGALSSAGGSVEIDCAVANGQLEFVWRERGGPQLDGARKSNGFGAYLADRVVVTQFEGRMETEWQPKGLTIRVWLPLERLMPPADRS